jgi:hypothetical protein
MGPKEAKSTVLSALEEAAIVSLRVQARLPLDDVYIALKDVIPHLSRSSLHRCLQRHGISRLPKADQEKPKRFKAAWKLPAGNGLCGRARFWTAFSVGVRFSDGLSALMRFSVLACVQAN